MLDHCDHTSKRNVDILFSDMMEVVMESGHRRAPLNLKVLAYHSDRVSAGEALPLELLDLKTVMMPRQWFLKKLDPDGSLSDPKVSSSSKPSTCCLVRSLRTEYTRRSTHRFNCTGMVLVRLLWSHKSLRSTAPESVGAVLTASTTETIWSCFNFLDSSFS